MSTQTRTRVKSSLSPLTLIKSSLSPLMLSPLMLISLILIYLLFLPNILFAESEPNETCSTANLLLDTSSSLDSGYINGTVNDSNDNDYFKIILTQRSELRLDKHDRNNKKTKMKLLESDCSTQLGYTNSKDKTDWKFLLDAGTYYLYFYRSNTDDAQYKIKAKMNRVADFTITKTVDNLFPSAGDTVTYTITATNDGPSNSKAHFFDTLPTGLTYLSKSTCSKVGNGIDCKKWLSAGSSSTVTLKATVDSGASGIITNSVNIEKDNTNSTGKKTFESDLTNNNATATIIIGCDYSLDTSSNDSSPGVTIADMNNITTNTTDCISGASEPNDSEYYKFTVGTYGVLRIDTSSPNNNPFHLKIGSTENGDEYYADTVTAEFHTVSDINLEPNDSIYLYIKETGEDTDIWQINFDFAIAPPPPGDEDIPNDDSNATEVMCGTFEDMFQTHGTCTGSSGGTINFNNAGSLLDGSTNITLENSDNSLNTCQVTADTWVSDDYETCGEKGDCIESGTNSEALTINYSNPPSTTTISASPSSSTDDLTLSSDSTLAGYEYDDITTGGGNTNIDTAFDITNQLKINTLKMTTDNTFDFRSSNPYSLEIGTLGIENNGVRNRITNDVNAKNIKINTFNLASETYIDIASTQTIKMDNFTVGRGSEVYLQAQYININNFTSSNDGSGDSTIEIYADYIDISNLTLNQTVILKIYPFTPGKRVLFKVNNLTESSSSSILLSSGNYYINSNLSIPGTSDISALRAIDENQLINLFINSDLTLGNNPGINALGNKGNYDTSLPAVNFMMFINGDLTTGGGGTTINATIYTEGDATFENPTYIKGAISANTSIEIGQGQFTYDQSISNAGWAECIPDEPPFDEECGLFTSVLTSYEHLSLSQNDVLQSCFISYPDGNFTSLGNNDNQRPSCFVDEAMNEECEDLDGNTDNGTCNYTSPPENRFSHSFITSSDTSSSTNSDDPAELTDYQYGNIDFNSNNQEIHFNPSNTYSSGSTRKVMVFGDIILSANNQVLTFEAGDYYFKSLDFQQNGIIIQPIGDVRFFIEDDFNYAGNGTDVTDPDASIFVYVGGNVEMTSTGGGNGWLGMFIYAEGDVTIASESNTKFYGGITAEGEIDVTGNNFQFEYNEEGADNLGMGECVPIIEFTQGSYSFDEPAIEGGIASVDYFTVTAAIDIAVSYDITVSYETYDDNPLGTFSAIENVDYTPYNFYLTIPAGDLSTTIKTTILRDDLIELDETFNARLFNPLPSDGVMLGDQNTTQLIINEQDEEDIPLCFADNFNTTLDDKWRLLSSDGGWIPRLVDSAFDATVGNKRLRLTDRQKRLATAVTKDYEFLAEHNMIIVEFDQYAYGGCEVGQTDTRGGGVGSHGADGIVMVLFDSQVGDSPTPGAFGGSVGYAQRTGIDGFEAGWIGLGIDEYGNFSNPTEGRDGGVLGSSPNNGGTTSPNNITIRGSSDTLMDGNLSTGSLRNGYKYLDGAFNISDVASKDRSPEFPNDRYRLKIDARNPTKLLISLDRDTGSGYQSVIPVFDAKEAQYNQAPAPEYVRLAFTSGSGGGCNNHDIDELIVRGVCRAYEAEFPPSKGAFDAWEIFGDISNRNIQTKISNQSFDLAIASINSSNNAIEVKEDILMQYRLYDMNQDINLTSWRDYNASTESVGTNAKGASEIDSFISASAHKDARIQFSFCGEVLGGDVVGELGYTIATLPTDINGNIIREINGSVSCDGNFTEILDTYSTDNFAIRPDKFDSNLTINPTVIAGKSNSIEFRADKDSGAFTDDYNETENSSFIVDINISDLSKVCAVSSINFSPNINFVDGNATSDFNLSNVGDFNITIQERSGFEFAKVDENDTSDIQRYITPYTNQISIIPDHFEVNASYINGSSGFTYLSDFIENNTTEDRDISSLLELNITAKDENNITLSNYTDTCYAKDGNISLTYTFNNPPNNLNDLIWYKNVYDINGSISIADNPYIIPTLNTDFNSTTDGKTELSYRINFDRNSSLTVNPFVFNIANINIADSNGTLGTVLLNQSATFYYGRVHAPDYQFPSSPGSATIYYEVYSEQNQSTRNSLGIDGNESIDSINWYVNILHDSSDEGNTTLLPISSAIIGVLPNSSINMTDGQEVLSISTTKTPYKDKINFDPSSSWLRHYPEYFIVEFFKDGKWAGQGKQGKTIDLNISTKQNKRLDW